jgi:antitoxin YefM
MRIVKFSEARNSFKGVMDQTIADADFTIITRRDAPDAVLMSLDTFNSLMEGTSAGEPGQCCSSGRVH